MEILNTRYDSFNEKKYTDLDGNVIRNYDGEVSKRGSYVISFISDTNSVWNFNQVSMLYITIK